MQPRSFAKLTLGLALVAATAAFAQAPATTPAAAPQVVVAEPVHDAGSVSKGEKVTVDFVLENRGSAELEVTDVRPACGCTVASFDRKIAPGGKGKVHAVLDTVDFQGAIAKTVTVLTNDPANPKLTLTIKAKIEPHVAVFPGYARYVYVQTLEPGTLVQTLWALDQQDFRVLEVQSPYPFIHATLREAAEDERHADGIGRQWRIEMSIQPDATVGPLREFLVVKTNHPKQKEVRIPISGFVRPLLHVTPQVADFGAVDGLSEPREIELTLVNFGNDTITIEGIDSDRKGVAAKAMATELGRRFKILVTLSPEAGKGHLAGTLKIKTSNPKMPVVELPVKAAVS